MARYRLAAYTLALCLLLPGFAAAQNVKTGYKSLEKREYDKAYDVFLKSLPKAPVEAAMALAELHGTKDTSNTHYSLDTAFTYVSDAEAAFCRYELEEREKLVKAGITFDQIVHERDTLYDRALAEAREAGEAAHLEHFLGFYSRYPERRKVELERDSLAFEEAKAANTPEAYKSFLDRYPTARQFPDARKHYDDALFAQAVAANSLEAFEQFLSDYPHSDHVGAAQDSVFVRVVPEPATESALYDFTQKYPENRNAARAWRQLYELVCYDYLEDTYLEFLKKYPSFPNKTLVYDDTRLARTLVLPARRGAKLGFVNAENGREVGEMTYNTVRPFAENVAVVQRLQSYRFINKHGEELYKKRFKAADDFRGGMAIACVDEGCGLINKKGEWVLNPTFHELVYRGAERYAARTESGWQLLDAAGKPLTPALFTEMDAFRGSVARVKKDNLYGVINVYGNEVLPPVYDSLGITTTGGIVARKGNLLAVATPSGKVDSTGITEVLTTPAGCLLVRKGNTFLYLAPNQNWLEPLAAWEWHAALPGLLQASAPTGRLIVRQGGKLGVLDANYKPLWVAADFSAVISLDTTQMQALGVKKAGKWGVIGLPEGNVIVPPSYDTLHALHGPYVAVGSTGRVGALSLEGRPVVPLKYDGVQYLPQVSHFVAVISGKLGLVNAQGLEVLSTQYDAITPVAADIVQVEVAGKIALVRLETTTINFVWKEDGFPEFLR